MNDKNSKTIIIQNAYRNTDICAICLKLVVKGNNCHHFHKQCIINYIKYCKYNCPICKKKIVNIDYDYCVIKSFLITIKNKLKNYQIIKQKIIYNQANKLNLTIKEYIKTKITKNNSIKQLIDKESPKLYNIINYSKKTIKMCKIILSEYNLIKTNKLNLAIDFLNELLNE